MTICTVCQKKLGLTEVTYNLDNTVQSNVVTEPVCKNCHEMIDNSILSFRNVKTVADIERIHTNLLETISAGGMSSNQPSIERIFQFYKTKAIERINDSSAKINNLRQCGYSGYWEYETLSFVDLAGGLSNLQAIRDALNNMGLCGWKLVSSHVNEIGKNQSGFGIAGASTAMNETIDETVLIFERFVKFQ